MMQSHKSKLMEFIQGNIGNFENETKIDAYLDELKLPYSLDAVMNQTGISEFLWEKISEVQKKGGIMYLNSGISTLQQKNGAVVNKLNELETNLMVITFFNIHLSMKRTRTLRTATFTKTPGTANQAQCLTNSTNTSLANTKVHLSFNFRKTKHCIQLRRRHHQANPIRNG